MDGGIIGGRALMEMMGKGVLFADGTWDGENVRAAKYDLRLSDELLVVRNPNRDPLYVREGERRKARFTIEPGGMALVSTKERLRLPLNIAANIGNKFEYIAHGALMLNGLHVDPGYGWDDRAGKPLFFMLANTSAHPLPVVPGETVIGVLQFLRVRDALGSDLPRVSDRGDQIIDQFFGSKKPPELGLGFFETMTELRQDHNDLEKRFEEVEKGAQSLIQFGVFLVAATILVTFAVFVIEAAGDEDMNASISKLVSTLSRHWPGTLALLGILFFVSRLVQGILDIAGKVVARISRPRSVRSRRSKR